MGRSGNISTNVARSANSVESQFGALIAHLDRIAETADSQTDLGNVLRTGAVIIRESVRGLIEDADKPVKRYNSGHTRAAKGSGQVKATYYPGNLRNAVQVMKFKNSKALFVGYSVLPRGKARGSFKSESKVDGYYGRFVEIKSAPLRRGFDAAKDRALAAMERELRKLLMAVIDHKKPIR